MGIFIKTIEDRVHDMLCDYVTKRIRAIRVDGDMKVSGKLEISNEMKDELDKALNLFPSSVLIERNK